MLVVSTAIASPAGLIGLTARAASTLSRRAMSFLASFSSWVACVPRRVARASYPVRSAVGEFVEGLPCNVIGHRWVEVADALRRQTGKKMRFKCSRCHMTGGFTN